LVADGATLVDLGFGETSVTTEEWAARVPRCRVIGIEARAPSPSAAPNVTLVQGSFERCADFAPVALVRVMNVLRGYPEGEVDSHRAVVGRAVAEGGLVIEGSTDTGGQVLAAWLLRKRGGRLHEESLLLHTDFSRGFSPWLFRDWLPRDLRRGVKPGTAIHAALSRWEARADASGQRDARARFEASLGQDVAASGWEQAHGFARLSLR
jgi:hypothetical protein